MRAVIALVVIVVAWVAYISSKQLERNHRIEKEVAVLSQEAEKIRRENETLADRISYFSSSEFREQEAKDKLGLKKPEETVVIIKQEPDSEESGISGGSPSLEQSSEREEAPNYQKWWDLFFENM